MKDIQGSDDFQSQAHHEHHRQSSGSTLTEASSIAQQYRSTAARERSAFGIPPSESDEFNYNAEQSFIQPLSISTSEWSFTLPSKDWEVKKVGFETGYGFSTIILSPPTLEGSRCIGSSDLDFYNYHSTMPRRLNNFKLPQAQNPACTQA